MSIQAQENKTASTTKGNFSFINKYGKAIRISLYYSIPAVITFLILAIVFKKNDFYPFGELSVAWCDLKQQGIPLLMNLKDTLSGDGSILFSINNASGMNFFGVFLFFLSNPFSFLSVFVEKADIYKFVNVLIILKLCLASSTAAIFFSKCNKKLNMCFGIVLSVSYALCAYGLMYYQNIMWLDLMYLYPLLALGIRKIITEKKYLFYTITLALCVIFNFYLSFMVIISVILTIGVYLLFGQGNKFEKRHTGYLFFKGSALSALLSAVSWVPAFLQYSKSGRGKSLIETLENSGFNTRFDTIVLLILSSMIIVIGIFALLKPNRKGLICAGLFFLYIVPVFIEPINKMWHTGNYMSFPGRYAFITIFTGMELTAIALEDNSGEWIFTKLYRYIKSLFQPVNHEIVANRKSNEASTPSENGFSAEKSFISKKAFSIISTFVFAVCGVLVVYPLFTKISLEFFEHNEASLSHFTTTLWGDERQYALTLEVASIFGFVYFVFAVVYFIIKRINKNIFALVLMGVVVCESVFALNVYVTTVGDNNVFNNYEAFLDLEGKIQDDSFYRVKTQNKYHDSNILGAIGYNSTGHYTSLSDGEYMSTYKALGYSSSWMELNTYGGTELSDAILGIKYQINRWKNNNSIYTNDNYNIVETFGALGLGVIYNGENDVFSYDDCSRIEFQEKLFKSLFNSEDTLFTCYSPTSTKDCTITEKDKKVITMGKGEIIYEIEIKGKQTLYFDAFGEFGNALYQSVNKGFEISVNGGSETIYPNGGFTGFVNLGTYEDTTVKVRVETKKSKMELHSFNLASLNLDVLENALNNTNSGYLNVSGNKVFGSVEGKNGDHLFVSIPYDKGFKVTVNDKKVEAKKVYGDFYSIPLTDGDNFIEMIYTPSGLVFGIVTFIIALCIIILDFVLRSRRKKSLSFADGTATGNGDTDTVNGDTDTVSGDTDTVNGDTDTVSGDTDTVSGDADTASGDADTVSGDTDTVSGDTDTVNGDTDTVSGDADTVSGDADTVSGDADTVNGDTDTVSGDTDTVSGDADTVNGDTEPSDTDTNNHNKHVEASEITSNDKTVEIVGYKKRYSPLFGGIMVLLAGIVFLMVYVFPLIINLS